MTHQIMFQLYFLWFCEHVLYFH